MKPFVLRFTMSYFNTEMEAELHYELATSLELLTISSYGVEVMGTFLRAMLLIVANLSLYDRE